MVVRAPARYSHMHVYVRAPAIFLDAQRAALFAAPAAWVLLGWGCTSAIWPV